MQTPLLGERTCRRAAFLINFVFWALFIGLFWVAGRVITQTLLPFVSAFLLAAILQKPLTLLETRLRFTHGAAAFSVSVTALFGVGGLLTAAVWRGGIFLLRILRSETTLDTLQRWVSSLKDTVITLTAKLGTALPGEYADALQQTAAHLETAVIEYGTTLLTTLSGKLMSFTVGALPRFLLAALFFVLAFVFFTKDFSTVTAFCLRQVPVPQRPIAKAAARALKETTLSVGKAYLLLGLVTFLELGLGFWILDIPHPLLWAGITALVDALPVLGVGAVLFPIAAVRFLSGNWVGGAAVLLLYAVVTVVRHLLQPRFVSRETGLPPLITLLTMYAGWRAAGIIGLLTAPVFAMVLLRLQKEGYLHIFK